MAWVRDRGLLAMSPGNRILPKLAAPSIARRTLAEHLTSALFQAYARSLRTLLLLPDGSTLPVCEYRSSPRVFAFFERDILPICSISPYFRLITLVAPGRDGNCLCMAMGTRFVVVRGSSRHSGTQTMWRLLETIENHSLHCGVAVDGPLGPPGTVHPGALICARRSGRRLVPLVAMTRFGVTVPGSWSGMQIPLAGCRVVLALGQPRRVSADAGKQEVQELCGVVRGELEVLRKRAESFLEHPFEDIRGAE